MVSATVLTDDEIDFGTYINLTDASHKVKNASQWEEDLRNEIAGKSEWSRQTYLPWSKSKDQFAFRPGEVTLWFGFNGSGKSLVLGQVAMSQAAQGEIVLIASFEMKPRRSLARMLRQWAGKKLEECDDGDVGKFLKWCDNKMFLYDQTGTADPQRILAMIAWAADNKGVTHVVIDNLIKCVRSDEDYEGQKLFVDALTAVARDKNIHVHLVHHPRKAEDESRPPRKMDSRGASAVIDLVDNIMVTWKNKPKMDAQQRGDPSKNAEPDGLVICDKQRNGEWEGRIQLWFHFSSHQFVQSNISPSLDLSSPFPHRERYGI